MGEIADAVIDGELCQQCGEYIGPGDGFPRTCAGCKPKLVPGPKFGRGKYLRCSSGKRLTHIINPATKRTFCQAENNASRMMILSKEPAFGARMCKNCEAMEKASGK
jgi:hypothetical protein